MAPYDRTTSSQPLLLRDTPLYVCRCSRTSVKRSSASDAKPQLKCLFELAQSLIAHHHNSSLQKTTVQVTVLYSTAPPKVDAKTPTECGYPLGRSKHRQPHREEGSRVTQAEMSCKVLLSHDPSLGSGPQQCPTLSTQQTARKFKHKCKGSCLYGARTCPRTSASDGDGGSDKAP